MGCSGKCGDLSHLAPKDVVEGPVLDVNLEKTEHSRTLLGGQWTEWKAGLRWVGLGYSWDRGTAGTGGGHQGNEGIVQGVSVLNPFSQVTEQNELCV